MYRDNRKRTSDRIVGSYHNIVFSPKCNFEIASNPSQPWVRPIKRGKGGGKDTEFGMKINASVSEGMTRMDYGSFDAFHEGLGLKEQIEAFKALYGYYPATVLADKIYWTRENRNYLKERGISHGGVAMGKKPKRSKYEKYKERRKNNERSEIEGKFGTAKTKYGMERMRTRLQQTTFASINMMFLAMNLLKLAGRGVIIMRPCKEYIFFGVFALVITAISDIKYELTELFDKYLRLSLAQGGNQMRLQRMRLTF